MKTTLLKLITVMLLVSGISMQGQENQLKKGQKQVDRYAYKQAISVYENLARKGHGSLEVYQNLADAYYFNGQLLQAHPWYEKIFETKGKTSKSRAQKKQEPVSPEYYYRYSQTLKAVGEYQKSDQVMMEFQKLSQQDPRAEHFSKQPDYLDQIQKNSGRYLIKNLDINSPYSDYGSTVYNKELIFVTARDTGSVAKKIHTWTGDSFTRFYKAKLDQDQQPSDPKVWARELKRKYNQGPAVFSKDGKTIYFTANNPKNNTKAKPSAFTSGLYIYQASLVNGNFTNIKALPFNSPDFNTAHPALSNDGKWMYFASDRPKGSGQSDLYKVAIGPNGSFGKPVSLGREINTPGKENFVFVSAKNELYFSSDGHPGLGGLDIFVAQIQNDGSLSEIQNVGAPVNSALDDFAFYIDTDSKKGFFSSNRPGGKGLDDIYSFIQTQELHVPCTVAIVGMVYDKQSLEPLAKTTVSIYDPSGALLHTTQSSQSGTYEFKEVDCQVSLKVKVALEPYNTAEVTVEVDQNKTETQVDFGLERARIEVKKGDDLFKVLELKPIYFDFDQAVIRQDAAVELAKIVEVLNQYPQMKIDVRSHTDSRGDDVYNMGLSDRRAKATRAWILQQGIAKDRVDARGYGESQLLNQCSNGKPCSEEDHQENRRSEFIVLEL